MDVREYLESRISFFEKISDEDMSTDSMFGVVGEVRNMVLRLGFGVEFGQRSGLQFVRALKLGRTHSS